ncbi:glucosyltransferase domain-containing protein [Patescibacteria group bacterium]
MSQKQKQILLSLAIFIGLGFVINLFFLPFHLGPDGYYVGTTGKHIIEIGRPLAYLIFKIFRPENLRDYQAIFVPMSIVFLATSAFLVFWKLKESIKPKRLLTVSLLASSVWVSFNVFSAEMMAFPENMPAFSLANLLVVSAALVFAGKSRWRFVYAFLLLIASSFFYQAWILLFASLFLVFWIAKTYGEKKSIGKKDIYIVLQLAILEASAILVNYLFMRFAGADSVVRLRGEVDLTQNAIRLIKTQLEIWINSHNYFPKYSLIVIFLLLGIFTITFLLRHRAKSRDIILYAVAVIHIIVAPFVLFLPIPVPVIDSTRDISSFASFIGIMLLSAVIILSKHDARKSYLVMASAVSGALLLMNIILTWQLGVFHLETNRYEEETIHKVNDVIEQYEESSRSEIKGIRFVYDKGFGFYQRKIPALTKRVMKKRWQGARMFNYHNNRDLQVVRGPIDPVLKSVYFTERRLNSFQPEHVVIMGGTAYIALYECEQGNVCDRLSPKKSLVYPFFSSSYLFSE